MTVRRFFHRAGALYRRVARRLVIVPMRWRGVVLALIGAYVTFWIGEEQSDYLLYPAGLCAIALVAVCAACVVFGAVRVWLGVRHAPAGAPEALDTGRPARTTFRLPRLAAWPLIDVKLAWDDPANVDVELERVGMYWQETITPHTRGRHDHVTRLITVEDIFGLTAVSFRITRRAQLRIAPSPAHQGADLALGYGHGDAFSHPAGRAEGDLVEMRQYGYGDSVRHVLWKTYARTRRLLVRMPERAIAPKPTTVAFLVAGAGDEPSCAAARLYLESKLFGQDFMFCADGAIGPASDTEVAIDQIIDSAAVPDAAGGASLETAAAQMDNARLASCVVFAPAVDGAWRERVVAFAGRLPAPPTVIIGVDGVPPPGKRPLAQRLLTRDPSAADRDAQALAGVPALRERLEAEGLRVQILHRTTGQLL